MNLWTNIMAILGVVGMCVTFNDTATFGKIAAFLVVAALFAIADEIRWLRRNERQR